jgi:D-serine deaminase-like pyridoxal phosphate-dependent protein
MRQNGSNLLRQLPPVDSALAALYRWRMPFPTVTTLLVAIAILLSAGACSRPSARSAVSDSTFVATITELRTIEADQAMDSTARDSARAAVLRSHGISAADLEQAARVMAHDPDRAMAVWRAIERRAEGSSEPTAP